MKCFPNSLTDGMERSGPLVIEVSKLGFALFLRSGSTTHEQALSVIIKRIVQVNIKRQKHATSVKNVMFIPAKTVSINTILVII